MDKALEKINILLKEIDNIKTQIIEIETLEQQNIAELENLKNQKDKLISEKEELIKKIEHIKYIKQNINNWKKKTIIITSLILSFNIIASTYVAVKLGLLEFLPFLYAGLTPYSFFLGEYKDYYKSKKHLKKYSLLQLEEKSDDLLEKLGLINEKNNNINKSNKKLQENKTELLNRKDSINIKIEDIRKMRAQVTENFLTDNKHFEEIVNSAFEQFVDAERKKK